MNPHPHVSTGKENNPLREAVRRINKPIFDKVLQENKNNHELVGGSGAVTVEECAFFNPHNARYYFVFDKKSLSPIPKEGLGAFLPLEVFKSGEFCAKEFFGCRIVVKKKLVEVTNKVDKDRLFKIKGSASERKALVVDAVAQLEKECINALKEFVKVYGGKSDFVVAKSWIPDNKILHDGLVDAVPSMVTFRNEVVKKVYNSNPKNVEFSNPVFASNFFRNSGLYDFVPEIADGLSGLREEVSLLKSYSYVPLKESLLSRLSEAFLDKSWVVVSSCLRELLVLDRILFGELYPVVSVAVLQNGGVIETFK